MFHSKVWDNKVRFVVNTSTECKRLAGSCSSNQVQKIDKVSVTGNEPFVKRQIGVPCWCLGRSHIISGRDSSFLETYFGSLALSCNGIYQQRISEILEDVTLVGFEGICQLKRTGVVILGLSSFTLIAEHGYHISPPTGLNLESAEISTAKLANSKQQMSKSIQQCSQSVHSSPLVRWKWPTQVGTLGTLWWG